MSFNNNEAPETRKAREKIKEIFEPKHYIIEEEVPLTMVTNNLEEPIIPPYRADMVLSKIFIIEFDSKRLHGTHRKIIHDRWRDKNIKNQLQISTVRLISKDVLKQSPKEIIAEIDSQL